VEGNVPSAMLVAQQLAVAINGRILVNSVSLTLQPGEVLALVGPNGAGKTTLLRLLAGDLTPTSGTVLLNGVPLEHLGARAQALHRAVLRQHTGLAFAFRAYDVALMGRYPHMQRRGETHADHAATHAALERTESSALSERHFPSLSGGEQTRVLLAKTLAQAAPVLLLDEPTAALDLRYQHATLRLARQVAAAGGAALVILHDLNLAATYADRIGLLHQGRLLALGTPWQVLQAERLTEVYQVPVHVQRHPVLDVPLVLALPPDTALELSIGGFPWA
jgi:iron complex transport system ATP-binding protein